MIGQDLLLLRNTGSQLPVPPAAKEENQSFQTAANYAFVQLVNNVPKDHKNINPSKPPSVKNEDLTLLSS